MNTIILDIDGTILKHAGSVHEIHSQKQTVLPGVYNKFTIWESRGDCIILISARRESMRKMTEKQLSELGIFYDQLILGVGNGTRYLINDSVNFGQTAVGITVVRDQGLHDISI